MRKWFRKCVTVFSMFDDVVSRVQRLFLSNLSAWMFFCGWKTVAVKCLTPGRKHSVAKNLPTNLITIISGNVRWDAVMDEPMFKEDIRNVLCCSLRRWSSSSQLEVSVSNDKYVLIALFCFWKWSHDIHFKKVEWSCRWGELQSTPMAVLGAVFCATWVYAYNVVDIGSYAGPVKIAT